MDAAVVKSLNSTFGTQGYKPLDELILKGSKRLVASDAPFARVDTGSTSSTGTYRQIAAPMVDVGKIVKPIVDGSVRVYTTFSLSNPYYVHSSDYVVYGYLYVYVNDVLKNTAIASSPGEYSSAATHCDISFSKDDRISFKLRAKLNVASSDISTSFNFGASISSIYLNANITDNLIEIL